MQYMSGLFTAQHESGISFARWMSLKSNWCLCVDWVGQRGNENGLCVFYKMTNKWTKVHFNLQLTVSVHVHLMEPGRPRSICRKFETVQRVSPFNLILGLISCCLLEVKSTRTLLVTFCTQDFQWVTSKTSISLTKPEPLKRRCTHTHTRRAYTRSVGNCSMHGDSTPSCRWQLSL